MTFTIKKSKRRGQVLFIDARNMGRMEDRTHRVLDEVDAQKIVDVYHVWQNKNKYTDELGFCKSVGIEEIREHGHVLTPGRYVGVAPQEEGDGESFEQKMRRLAAELGKQQSKARKLDKFITKNIRDLGFAGMEGGV